MSATIYLLTICLPLGAIVLVFALRYRAKVKEAQAILARDDAWRSAAESSTAAQAETASSLSALRTTLDEVRARLAAIETVLKAVE